MSINFTSILNGQKEGADKVLAYLMILYDIRFQEKLGDVGSEKRKKASEQYYDSLPEWFIENS